MSKEDQSIFEPRLFIDTRSETIGVINPTTQLLGLTLCERLIHVARKAGFLDILVLVDEDSIAIYQKLLKNRAEVSIASFLPASISAPSVLVPSNLLGEVSWLAECKEFMVTLAVSQNAGNGIIFFCKGDVFDKSLSKKYLSFSNKPFLIMSELDVKQAETRLMKSLWKTTDGFMSQHVSRPISLRFSRILAPLGVTPNQMTIVSMLIGLVAAPFFLSADPSIQVIGGLLFVAHSILDGCDGELARLTYRETRFGGLLDFFSDNLVHIAVFACMALGWSTQVSGAWPLYFGAGAVFGTAGSAYAVYWLTLRYKVNSGPIYTSVSTGPSGRLTKILDELSRRDFIYLVLALSAFGLAQWFVAAAGIGAPIFCIMVLITAQADSNEATRPSA